MPELHLSVMTATDLLTEIRDRLEPILERFEVAWERGERPDLEQFLAGLGPAARLMLLIELVNEDLEYRLMAGEAMRAETYFSRFPELRADPEVALGLIGAEYVFRRQHEPGCAPDEYLRRFPELRAYLAAWFRAQGESAPDGAVAAGEPQGELPGPGSAPAPAAEANQEAIASETMPTRLLAGRPTALPAPFPPSVPLEEAPTMPSPATVPTKARLPSVPGYTVLRKLGQGRMGVVYQARHIGLKRLVALKMIRSGVLASEQEGARFHTEAEALARLQHAHIVQIHEVGECDGYPFFSMELVEGGSLAARLNGTPWPGGRAADLVATLARAMDAAHKNRVIHRDLKPQNILLTLDGTPKITDFGLAKRLDQSGGQTASDAIMGTPGYMPPEQAEGGSAAVGPAADIYSLGAILYELLTGRPPFKGATVMDTLDQVRTADPLAPRQLVPQLPRDLETICLKCLHKDPMRRYATAAALADDLGRYQAHKPILARPTALWEHGVKWARRQPQVAAVLGLLAVVTVAGFVAVLAAWRKTDAAYEAEAEQRRQTERQLYLNRVALADRELSVGKPAWAKEHLDLCPVPLRRWEWHHLERRCRGEPAFETWRGQTGAISSVAIDAKGTLLASAGGDHTVRLWEVAKGKTQQVLQQHQESVNWVAINADGTRLASASDDKTVILWDLPGGKPALVFRGHQNPVSCVAFHPRQPWVASASFSLGPEPCEVQVWDASTGKVLLTLTGHTKRITGVAFSPDGKFLASCGHDDTVRVYNSQTGAAVLTFTEHTRPIAALAFSPDGEHIASAAYLLKAELPDQGEIFIWKASSGAIVHRCHGHYERVLTLAFSPDGQRLASAGRDKEIRLWDLATGQETLTLRGHEGAVMSVAFSKDGHRLASGSLDRTIKIWDGSPWVEPPCQPAAP